MEKRFKALLDFPVTKVQTKMPLILDKKQGRAYFSAIEALERGERPLLVALPRFGKTVVAINILNRNIIKNARVLIVTPSETINKDWKRQMEYYYSGLHIVEFSTYRKLPDVTERKDVVIFDEIHRITPRSVLNIDRIIGYETIVIGITATPPRKVEFEKNKIIYEQLELKQVFEYRVSQAIKEGETLPFKIKKISYYLPLSDITDYEQFATKIAKVDRAISALSKRRQWKQVSALKDKKKNLNLERMRWLNNHKIRHTLSKLLLKKYLEEGKRVLVFTNSIKNAEYYGNAFHTKNDDFELVEKFNRGEINYLTSVNKLREGVNFSNVDIVMITAFNSDYKEFLQKIGRAINPRTNSGEVTVVWPVILGTREQQWFEDIMKKLDVPIESFVLRIKRNKETGRPVYHIEKAMKNGDEQ